METPLLSVKDLRIQFNSREGVNEAVKGINFDIEAGKTLAVVGESGSGKSVSAMALTRLLPKPPICEINGQVHYDGQDVMAMSSADLRHIRGKEIAYIFQEPSVSLNPVFTIGSQIAEAIKLHMPHIKDVNAHIIDALDKVGIRDAEKRIKDYPHQLSGGMQQRVMIAMALVCEPRILVADEPTTALDVTIQAQIMDLLREVRERTGMAILLITHNFGIVNHFADDVAVMFRGEIVERGPVDQVLSKPEHPYTQALLDCIPRLGEKRERLTTIDHDKLAV